MKTLFLSVGPAVLVFALAISAHAQPARPLPVLTPAPHDALTRALEAGRLTEAEYALERARSLFQLGRVRREFGEVERPGGRDATLVLRDLAFRLGELRGEERAEARRILARPTGGDDDVPVGHGYTVPSRWTCGGTMCFHWVETSRDAPDTTDTIPPTDIPTWVGKVQETWESVWAKEVGAIGYRAPLDDSSSNQVDGPLGPDQGKLDVYILDLGADGIFGYCAPADDSTTFTVPVYCAVDNDYASSQFGTTETPLALLQVTTAHEFHHASQAAYDFAEDFWLLEGTATNMEETVYPGIDDNVFFLRQWSPLTRPASPVDRGGSGDSEYGSWIFWRYLEEKVGRSPAILREIWLRADASPFASFGDQHSLQAVSTELAQRGRTFADTFVRFAVTNRLRAYADAKAARYPTPPLAARHRIARRSGGTAWKQRRVNHLAAHYVAVLRGRKVGRRAKLAVRIAQPSYGSGARVALVVVRKGGSRAVTYPKPNRRGVVSRRVSFGRSIARVELALVNGSTRTECWAGFVDGPPWYSCYGIPRDDRRAFRYRASIVRR